MGIIEVISAFSATGILGGITGLIGNELKSRREIKLIKLENEMEQASWPERQKEREHAQAMRAENYAHELKLHDLNARAKAEESERAIMAQETINSGKGLLMALESDKAQAEGEPIWCGAVRTLTRPFLCVSMLALLAAIYFTSSPADRVIIVKAVIYMATASYLFFFGDRPSAAMRKFFFGYKGEGGA